MISRHLSGFAARLKAKSLMLSLMHCIQVVTSPINRTRSHAIIDLDGPKIWLCNHCVTPESPG